MKDKESIRIKELEDRHHKYIAEINRLEFQNARLQIEAAQLKTEVRYKRGLKNQAKEFYQELDSYIVRAIDRRGYSRKPKPVNRSAKIDVDTMKIAESEKLIIMAREYDARSFFRYHSPKSDMKVRYRIASKTYRTARDLTKTSVKKAYRLTSRSKG